MKRTKIHKLSLSTETLMPLQLDSVTGGINWQGAQASGLSGGGVSISSLRTTQPPPQNPTVIVETQIPTMPKSQGFGCGTMR